jgi:hypothetical protein
MNKLLVATFALVTVFSMPASAALTGPGSPPRFRDIPEVSTNPEHQQVLPTGQDSQSQDTTDPVNDPAQDSQSQDATGQVNDPAYVTGGGDKSAH